MLVVFKNGNTVTFDRLGCEIYVTDYLLVFSQNDDFYEYDWNDIDYIKPIERQV